MKLIKLTILIMILLLTSCKASTTYNNTVQNGSAILQDINFLDGDLAKLNGDWFFWPDKLLNYNEVNRSLSSGYGIYNKYPGIWQKLNPIQSKKELTKQGTLAIKVDLPLNGEPWALRVPNASSATTIFLNSKKIGSIGNTSKNITEFIPSNALKIINFIPDETENILIVHVVNYSTPYTGTWDNMLIGLSQDINKKRLWNIIITSLISGALIFMGLYHITLYMLRRNDPTTLWFALICILMATRNLIMGERILLELFPETWLGWRIAFNVEHLSAHMTLPLFFLFFKNIFPGYVNKVMVKIVIIVAALWAALQIFTPVMIHQRFLSWYEYFLLVAAIYLLVKIFRAYLKKVDGASITLGGVLFLLLTSVNDVLLSNGIIQSFYVASFGVFIYTFTQSYFLSKRFSNLFNEVARYTKELKELNSSLERFIPQEILQYLNKDSIVDVKLGDFSEQEMSVFFLDIRDFTSFSETMSPSDNFKFINSFLKRFGPLIRRCGGFVDKYIGDGIMALFPGTPDNAIKAALYIRTTLIHFNNERMGYNLVPISLGIGINTGMLMLGTIGENQRMDSTVISDAVNTASRLENLTKELGIDILISQNTVKKLQSPERFKIVHIGDRHVKGKVENIDIYSIDWAD